jgi:3'-5' exoribonuclease
VNKLDLLHSWIVKGRTPDNVIAAAKLVLDNPAWQQAYGSSTEAKHHHAYPCGLVDHTWEVACGVEAFLESEDFWLNSDVLVLATVWHDFAKIYDYDSQGKKLPYYHQVRHVAGSYAEFMRQAAHLLDPELAMAVGHCILAHHGRKEWGSPIEPQTREAWILHSADMLASHWREK